MTSFSFLCLLALAPFSMALSQSQLDALKADITALIPTGGNQEVDLLGAMVRLPFHDAFGHDTKMDGCLDPNLDDHDGLQNVRVVLDPVCEAHKDVVSRADCWAVAGNVAIEAAEGNPVPFRFGRVDCADEQTVSDFDGGGESLLPSSNPGDNPWTHVQAIFGPARANLSPREIVALMGAHSLGRVSSDADNSGFSTLPWVPGQFANRLSSVYYSEIAGVPWFKGWRSEIPLKAGEWLQARGPQPSVGTDLLSLSFESIMLETDMCLVIDTSSCDVVPLGLGTIIFGAKGNGNKNPANCAFNSEPKAIVDEFARAGGQALFLPAFSAAMHKLEELGYSSWNLGADSSTWMTTLCEVTATSTNKACDDSTNEPTPEPEQTDDDSAKDADEDEEDAASNGFSVAARTTSHAVVSALVCFIATVL